jgi:hypothetical protein
MKYLSIVFEQTDIPGDIFKYLHVFTDSKFWPT